MRFALPIPLALICLLAWAQPAAAITMRSESIEYQTDQADVVVIAELLGPEPLPPGVLPRGGSVILEKLVTCRIVECVKGEWEGELTFDEETYYAISNIPRETETGERLLLFLSLDTRGIAVRVENWAYLNTPASKQGFPLRLQQRFFNNEGRRLTQEEELLRVVRSRQGRVARRGLVIERPLQPGEAARDYIHYFIVTAEPEYKQEFIDDLQAENYADRCDAIVNLVSYPGEETETLLRGMLDDRSSRILDITGATALTGATRGRLTYYPVRQSAYKALRQLGVSVEPPDRYYELLSGGLLQEDDFAFPAHNPWTADYDPSQSWGGWLAPVLLALGLPVLILPLAWRRGRFKLRSLMLVVAIAAGLCGLAAGPMNTVLAGENVEGELHMWWDGVGSAALVCLTVSTLVTTSVGAAWYWYDGRRRRKKALGACIAALVLLSASPAGATSYDMPERHEVYSPNGEYVLDVDPELEIHTVYAAADRNRPLWSFSRAMWHDPMFLTDDGARVAVVNWELVEEETLASDAVCVAIYSAEALETAFTYQQLCPRPVSSSPWGIGPVGMPEYIWYDSATQTGDTLTLETTDGKEVAINLATGEATAQRTLPAAWRIVTYELWVIAGMGVLLLLVLLVAGRKQPRAVAVGAAALLLLLAIAGGTVCLWWWEPPTIPTPTPNAQAAIAEYEAGRAEALAAPAGQPPTLRQAGYVPLEFFAAYEQQLADDYGVRLEQQGSPWDPSARVEDRSPFERQGYNSALLDRLIDQHDENIFRAVFDDVEKAAEDVGGPSSEPPGDLTREHSTGREIKETAS